jgi:hypothetical protein
MCTAEILCNSKRVSVARIIKDYDLVGRSILREHTANGLAEPFGPIATGHDDTHTIPAHEVV